MSSVNNVKRFTKDEDYISFVNNELSKFVDEQKPNHVPLGPDYGVFDHELSTEALQLHRLVKNFEIPCDERSQERAVNSIRSMLEYDACGLTSFNPGADRALEVSVRHTLYNARALLHEAITHYRFGVSHLELTSGETYVSARGDTSVYAKLRDVKQWCVTAHCFDHAAQLIYNSPMLRHAAKRHYKHWFDEIASHAMRKHFSSHGNYFPSISECKDFRRKIWDDYHLVSWDRFCDRPEVKLMKPTTRKYAFFREKLRKFVTIVPGARLTTVPKDNSVDRVILCEAWLDMLVERCSASALRDCIKKSFGIDLGTSQVLHGKMISDLSNATIDLKNASNSNWWCVVDWFFKGTRVHKHLEASRNRVASYGDTWYPLNMFAPNGNGMTFEVMTLMLLCVCRSLDSFAHVYGDDIIICRDVAQSCISTLEYMGYVVNTTKTFVSGEFRESCGSFYNGGYITSYDLHYANDIVDAIIVTNKIGIMANATNSLLSALWLKLHYRLLEVCPRDLLRPFKLFNFLSFNNLNVHVPDLADGVLIHHRRFTKLEPLSPNVKREMENFVIDHMDLMCDLNYKPYQFHKYRYMKKRSITYADGDPHWNTGEASRLLGWFYVWSGRSNPPPLRETKLVREYRIAIT